MAIGRQRASRQRQNLDQMNVEENPQSTQKIIQNVKATKMLNQNKRLLEKVDQMIADSTDKEQLQSLARRRQQITSRLDQIANFTNTGHAKGTGGIGSEEEKEQLLERIQQQNQRARQQREELVNRVVESGQRTSDEDLSLLNKQEPDEEAQEEDAEAEEE